jgi:DNA-directed RNA polymerase subunit RPC12/RpoP
MKCPKCGCKIFEATRNVTERVLVTDDDVVLKVLERMPPDPVHDDEFICSNCHESYEFDEIDMI